MSSIEDEATLGDGPEIPEAFQKVPDGDDPKTFDVGAWLAGVRKPRRSVTLYARLDLQAEIDRLAELEMKSTGKQALEYKQRASELQTELIESGIPFVIEGRSQSAVQALHASLEKAGIKDPQTVTFEQLASQIVSPEGVTVDDLNAFAEVAPAQVAKLIDALVSVQTQIPPANPRFSLASSGIPAGKASPAL